MSRDTHTTVDLTLDEWIYLYGLVNDRLAQRRNIFFNKPSLREQWHLNKVAAKLIADLYDREGGQS